MDTVLLGANGKLGQMLGFWAAKTDVPWKTQSRDSSCDVQWSGNFDDPACDKVLTPNATLINMIGATNNDLDTLHQMNVTFVDNLLTHAARNDVAHVILASSAAVYGGNGSGSFDENSRTRSANPYGASKIAMEAVAHAHAQTPHAPKITILRIGNVAGADAILNAARIHAASGMPLPIHRFKDGSAPIRSYIGAHDLFRSISDLTAPTDTLRVINLAHPQPVSLTDLVAAYRNHILPTLTTKDSPAPDAALQEVVLDTTKLASHTNFMKYDDPADHFAAQAATVLHGQMAQ